MLEGLGAQDGEFKEKVEERGRCLSRRKIDYASIWLVGRVDSRISL